MIAKARTEQIETCFQHGVLRIGINRPEKKNALSLKMYEAMAEALARAEEDERVRVLLLHGTAECFTSGNDLADFAHAPPSGKDSPVFRFLAAVSGAKKPLVAAVNGPAVGIGTTMLLHCDLVYAGEGAVFQLPFVNLGLCPEAASSYLLPKLAGHLRASELLLLGEPFCAEAALKMGLVNGIYPDGKLFQGAIGQARKLAEKPQGSVRLTKALLKESQAERVAGVMSREGRHFMEALAGPEAREAISAFLEGRTPDFSRC